VQATGIAANQVEISAVATDGTGGAGSPSGNGGTATLSSGGLGPAVFGSSTTGGTVTLSGTAIGGNGGSAGYAGKRRVSKSVQQWWHKQCNRWRNKRHAQSNANR
jgi:hypothetical protein